MTNLRLICKTVERGAVDGIRYGHNQYGPFESTNIWPKGMFEDGFYPMNFIMQELGILWATMTYEEKSSWNFLGRKNKTSSYAEFSRFNTRLMLDDLEPVKTPY